MSKIELGPGAVGDPQNPELSREEFLKEERRAKREERKAEREAEQAQKEGSE